MKKRFSKSLFHRLINRPFVLHMGQNLVGANKLKSRLYPPMIKKSGNLLDFGCSYGNSTPYFLDYDYYGLDIDDKMIEKARQQFKSYPNIKFFTHNVLDGEFKRDFFDNILFASSSHHIADQDLKAIFDALIVNLKPGGELHFFDIIKQPKDKLITRLLTRYDQGKNIRTLDEYKKFFKDKNYQIAEKRIFKSPKAMIQLWDFLYIKITK